MADRNRKRITTSLDTDLYEKASLLAMILKFKGVEVDGVNELLEEGLRKVLEEHEDVIGLVDWEKLKTKAI